MLLSLARAWLESVGAASVQKSGTEVETKTCGSVSLVASLCRAVGRVDGTMMEGNGAVPTVQGLAHHRAESAYKEDSGYAAGTAITAYRDTHRAVPVGGSCTWWITHALSTWPMATGEDALLESPVVGLSPSRWAIFTVCPRRHRRRPVSVTAHEGRVVFLRSVAT
ncbi:hypothetical protein BC834DRAFT_638927 [Gloeopeniophorella convolvens]|nr:hypothetical protein BC834DRAFT_638927 [Gloeopeniophorella convolvens]